MAKTKLRSLLILSLLLGSVVPLEPVASTPVLPCPQAIDFEYPRVSHEDQPPCVGIEQATKVATASGHTCALLADEEVLCWGDNDYGQIDVPDTLLGPDIAVNQEATCAIRSSDGAIICWGIDRKGAAPRFVAPRNGVPWSTISMNHDGSITCATDERGDLKCWGLYPSGHDYDVPEFVRKVDVGYNHRCLLTDDYVKCWGGGGGSHMFHFNGNETTQVYPQDISLGKASTCIVFKGGSRDGNVECKNSKEDDFFYENGDAIAVARGGNSYRPKTCVLTNAGNVHCFGHSRAPEPAQSYLGGDAVQVMTGGNTCVLLRSGNVDCFDSANTHGQAADYVSLKAALR